jgi:Family of unknown function (DUF6544)/Polyketide cyclase / dehydrase and lipid transport
MRSIEGEIVIGRPADVVFDYVTDQSNEPQYNPYMLRAEKVTPGPVKAGTEFRSAVSRMGRTADMVSTCTGYDRPRLLATTTTMKQADFDYTLAFEPIAEGTRMRWSGDVQLKGAFRLHRPLIIWIGRRQEQRIWENLKDLLERANNASPQNVRPPARAPAIKHRGARLFRRLAADADVAGLPATPESADEVGGHDLAALPDPARLYMERAGAIDHPADWSLQLHSRGTFRLKRGWPWMPCEAWQYNSAVDVARVFWMRIDAWGLPMVGRDSYVRGRGDLHGRLAGLLTVAHGTGHAYDVGELVTFLNDAVLFAPSMLLRLPVSWAAISDRTFEVTLADGGRHVTARVTVDDHGLPTDFSTEDRYFDAADGPVRCRWRTPVEGWREVGGRWQPSAASAVWELTDGPLIYARFTWRPGDVCYNIAPPTAGVPAAGRHRIALRS